MGRKREEGNEGGNDEGAAPDGQARAPVTVRVRSPDCPESDDRGAGEQEAEYQ